MKATVVKAAMVGWTAAACMLVSPSSHAAQLPADVSSGEAARKKRFRSGLWNHPLREPAAWGADNRARWSAFDRAAAEREDEQVRGTPDVPMRLGVNRPAPAGAIHIRNGRRVRHASGRFIWTYQLDVPEAQAVRIHFSRFQLPANSELVVADQGGRVELYQGTLEPFWTPPIHGDTVYLEYRSPVNIPQVPEIEIDEISHIYLDPLGINALASLACQVDVNCYDVPAHVRDAVGRLVFTTQSGTFMCTGTLLEDADTNTSAGYLLTANHCINTPAAAASLAVYWFYQTDACNGTAPLLPDLPRSDGSSLLVTSTNTDFTLLRLRDDPRDGQGFVESTTQVPSGQVVSIHHPRGEHKRVSVGQPTTSQPICGSYPTNRFLYLDWTMGITEVSSSGAPLFDTNWRLVGQLFGTCSFSTPNCTNSQDYNALFGRFSVTHPFIASHLQSVAPDDAYEDNDSLEQAKPIAMGTNALRLVDFDDYFSITLPRPARIDVTATFSPSSLDLDLALLTASGSVLLSSAGTTGTETNNSGILAAGTYVIHATKSHRWGGDYTLTVALIPNANAAPVAATDRFERVLTNGVKFLASKLLVNDSDADGDPLRLLSVDSISANGGTVIRTGDWVHYTPAAGFTNQDSFTYRIADFFNAIATGTVVVTNNITPVPSPNLFIGEAGNGAFVLRFDGVPGKTYGIEYSDSLNPPNWQRLGCAVADAFGRLEFMDIPPNGSPHRFYRAAYP